MPLLFRAVANNKNQQEVLDRAVRSTEDEETGCEFLKEARRWDNEDKHNDQNDNNNDNDNYNSHQWRTKK